MIDIGDLVKLPANDSGVRLIGVVEVLDPYNHDVYVVVNGQGRWVKEDKVERL